jgi:competence protein ComEC
MKRWPVNKAYPWERAPFLRLLLPLMAGIAIYPLWQGGNTVSLITATFAFFLFLATAIYKTQSTTRRAATFLSLHAFFIFVAFSLCYSNDVRNSRYWYGHQVNTADLFLARLAEEPIEKEKAWKIKLEMLEAVLPGNAIATKGEAFLYLYKDEAFAGLHKGIQY